MSENTKIKESLEAAAKQNLQAPTQAEAKVAAQVWTSICNGTSSTGLKSIGTTWRRSLEGAVVREEAQGREAALSELTRIALEYSK